MRWDEIILGDCQDILPTLPSQSINMILCDLPYGMTANKWDCPIPLGFLWEQYKRLLAPYGVIALTASQPFTSLLVSSNLSMFKHEWIWIKDKGSNFANVHREPMKEHESVVIFAGAKWTYNKQMQERAASGLARSKYLVEHNTTQRDNYPSLSSGRAAHQISEQRVPSSWQKFVVERGLHPTQKPVSLFEYLIRTYSNRDELVLDHCIGSGTTAVAAINAGRYYLGIESDANYVAIAQQRIAEASNL